MYIIRSDFAWSFTPNQVLHGVSFIRFLIKNSQHGVKHPTCKDLNTINKNIYLWSSCLRSLFSWSNFSRREGSCLDALMRSSVENSLLFALADEPVKETFVQGWMVFDTCDLRKCAIAEPNFQCEYRKLVNLPDVSFPGSKGGSWILCRVETHE